MQHTEIKLNSKEIFKGNVFRVTMDQVELENGMTSFQARWYTTTEGRAFCP